MMYDTGTIDKKYAAPSRSWWHWSAWVSYTAALWSLLYSALAAYWIVDSSGFPFGSQNDSGAVLSLFAAARAETGAPLIAALGLIGAAVAITLARAQVSSRRNLGRAALLAFAWATAVVLTLLVPDYRVLMAVAYAPIFLIGAPFGWPPVSFSKAIPWPVINQLICIAGGMLWAASAVVYQRRTRGACDACGRTDADPVWTTPAAAARWGRWPVAIAVIIPILYAATRWAWALGIPLGISEEFLREGQRIGLWWAGAGLATVAVGGALLTLGLVQRWGEVFPRWIPFVSGRRVPIELAVLPAGLVAVLVASAGLMFIRLAITGTFGAIFGKESAIFGSKNWAALAPELLWPLWGAALGAAALAYYYRRRGQCERCERGR
jgi:hypothetical protein